MADLRKHSSTSNVVRFKLTKSADGTAFTGLTSSSSGLIISTISDNEAAATAYTQAGSTIETITTLGTFAAPTSTKCRFKEVDATNHAGLYEFQFADARYSVASAKRLVISVSGVSGLFSADYEIQLTQADVYDAVRMGLTALPNAAPAAIGGLLTAPTTANTGLADVTRLLGTAWLTPGTAGTPDVSLTTTALGAIWNRLTSSLTVSGSIGKRIVDYLTGDIYTLVGPAGSGLTSLASQTSVDDIPTNSELTTALGTGSWATSLAQSSVWTSTLAAALAPIRSGTAQAGDSTTITLDASASSVTNFYVPCGIYLTGGTGAGQFRTIDEYNGTSKVATVSEPWYTTPDNTTTFTVRPEGVAHVDLRQLGGNELSAGYLKAIADYYGINTKIPAHTESIATDAISADAVSAAAGAKIADIARRRTQASVEASSDGDALSIGSLYGLIQQAQESNASDAAGYLTIYKTDGTTSLGTKVLSTNASADPVDGIS